MAELEEEAVSATGLTLWVVTDALWQMIDDGALAFDGMEGFSI